ncbi:MAG TPA: GNAT family N-acetyltransferase [Tepidiformaceae bacterium]|nr:GNAT family N-acetyltransferase [Tepidiformaceae bacterium]
MQRVTADAIYPAELVEMINEAYRRYEILQAPRIDIEGFHQELQPDSEFLLLTDADDLVACAMICAADGYFAATAGATSTKPDWLEGSERPSFEQEVHGVPFEGDLRDALYFGLAAVRRTQQNSGLGRLLVERAESIARERGARRVVLTTLREFGLPAYYERMGYRLVGVDEHPAGHWSITVPHGYCYMEKAL